MANDMHVVKMPKLGESVTEGTLTRWLKAVGDAVELDEPLFEVSTDKIDSEIPSPFAGYLQEIIVAEGETVPVSADLARIGSSPEAVSSSTTVGTAPEAPATEPSPEAAAEDISGQQEGAVSRTLQPSGTEPAAAAAKGDGVAPGDGATQGPGDGATKGLGPLSPVVRRLAAEHQIDLATVRGSGAGGRVRREDVQALITAKAEQTSSAPASTAAPAAAPAAAAAPAPAAPAAAQAGEVVSLSKIRLATAKHMVASRRTSAHVWTSIEVDLEGVEQVRQRHKNRFRKEEGVGLTYLTFIALAVCDGLRAFPAVNSSIDVDAGTQTFHQHISLGIAVDVEGQGLMAPVIKDAGSLNLRGMARAIRKVADDVRSGRAKPDDLTGSTFTISNPGPLGTYASAAIINQPNVGIITTEGVARRPTVVGDAIAIHHMSILGLSYDHRALDGVVAGQFLAHIRQRVEQRDWEAELG